MTKNTPGTLYTALGCFAERNINITYIQSRPLLGKPWTYWFYIGCTGSAKDAEKNEKGIEPTEKEHRSN